MNEDVGTAVDVNVEDCAGAVGTENTLVGLLRLNAAVAVDIDG